DALDSTGPIIAPALGVDGDAAHGAEIELEAATPNPAFGAARITYTLPMNARVRLTIHDVQGRTVATLVADEQAAGRHAIAWNTRGTAGEPLPAGLYLARLNVAGAIRTQKIVVTR